MTQPLAIHWFRQDLRLSDNPSLFHACQQGTILPIYILDDTNAKKHYLGAASRLWLHHALESLDQSLEKHLSLYKGDPLSILVKLCDCYGIKSIFWNRCYEPWRISRDTEIKKTLESKGISVNSFNSSLLWEPWNITKDNGTPYKVFTPFYKKGCLKAPSPRKPLPQPQKMDLYKDSKGAIELGALGLLPIKRWDDQIQVKWKMSESGAQQRLSIFLKNGISNYKEGRNLPAKPYVSKLSPYLHFGQISPNQVWYKAKDLDHNADIDHFCSELGWREFSYSQLYFNPHLPAKNLQNKFDAFPWKNTPEHLLAWQKGQTGIPFVDAGMRELWKTGYMHNRLRMVVGSFLVKNLMLHWQHGESWFWDCLLDADLASNSASWQWVAGCGADAAPYFRIFNPVTQAQKFDPNGIYIRKYVPEIQNLPDKYLFSPWEAPNEILTGAGVVLGDNYPKPIVNLQASRQEALQAFDSLR